jgi:transcriptional regulator with XRE-family HTH domain
MSRQAEYEKFLKKVAGNIKRYRMATKLTQMDMVNHGFNYRHYQRLESGSTGLNLFTLFRLSKLFNVNVSKLLE